MNARIKKHIWLFAAIGLICTACKISYSFTGSSIDYTTTKSITINDFPNQAALIYPPLSQQFTESVKDIFIRRTKLQMLPANGDIDLEGEIVGYDLAPMAVKEDAMSSSTKLTMTVRVRYSNRATPEKDFQQNFSAFQEFNSDLMLQTVQDELNAKLVEEITEQIFNSTVADW